MKAYILYSAPFFNGELRATKEESPTYKNAGKCRQLDHDLFVRWEKVEATDLVAALGLAKPKEGETVLNTVKAPE